MNVDDRRLTELIEESEDLQVDALRGMQASVDDLAEIREERLRAGYRTEPAEVEEFNRSRRRLLKQLGIGGLAARGLIGTGFAAAVVRTLAKPVYADSNLDIQILQTASSLERLAVNTYGDALGLPFISGGNATVKAFAMTTMNQHDQHRQAFQAQTQALGGKVQDSPNPKYLPIVKMAEPTLKGPADVVTLAATLEQVATDTYLSDLNMFTDGKSKQIMASVMGVESQHLATLRAVGALLAANLPALIAIPTDAAKLPAAAGSVAFPDPFEGITKASPPNEGALQ